MDTSIKNYQELANNIVIQAVKDYKRALGSNKPLDKRTVKDCESFFRSGWFALLTKLDGEMLLQKIKREVLNGRKTRAKHSKPHRNNL